MVFIPPTFNDLGKSCKDLFSKGFYLGEVKVEHKSRTRSGLEFTASGALPRDGDRMSGSIESKYKLKKYGVTLTDKFTANNVLTATLEHEDKLLQGLKLTGEGSLDMTSGKHGMKLKSAYKRHGVHVNSDLEASADGPLSTSSLVVGYQGFVAGALVAFNAMNQKLSKHALALGWQADDFALHTILTNGDEIQGLLFQKLNPSLEYGLQVKYNRQKNVSSFTAGFKYNVDNDSSVKAYVNNDNQLAFSYAHNLRHGVKLTLSTALNLKQLQQGTSAPLPGTGQAHRVGLGLEFESA